MFNKYDFLPPQKIGSTPSTFYEQLFDDSMKNIKNEEKTYSITITVEAFNKIVEWLFSTFSQMFKNKNVWIYCCNYNKEMAVEMEKIDSYKTRETVKSVYYNYMAENGRMKKHKDGMNDIDYDNPRVEKGKITIELLNYNPESEEGKNE